MNFLPCLHTRPPQLGAECPLTDTPPADGYYLAQTADGLWQLCHADDKPRHIDFADAFYRHRGGTEYLPKAFKGMTSLPLLDATAGWGRDAWLLAYRGFHLTLCERHPALYTLLAQGLARARENPLTATVAARLQVVYADSCEHLHRHGNRYRAIYLDPMYPPRQKRAQVKKEMQILQALHRDADSGDNRRLLQTALAVDGAHIVVKRPAHAAPLGDIAPLRSLHAPNTRYDIYLGGKHH